MRLSARLVPLVMLLFLACTSTPLTPSLSSGPTSAISGSAAVPTPTVLSCPERWRQRVRRPERFTEIAACVTLSGTVRAVKSESDGDYHVQVLPDPPADQYLNARNRQAQHGALVMEIEPWERGISSTAAGAVAINQHPPAAYCPAACSLKAGDRLQITSAILQDNEGCPCPPGNHGWLEAHSPSDIQIVGHTAAPHGNVPADPAD